MPYVAGYNALGIIPSGLGIIPVHWLGIMLYVVGYNVLGIIPNHWV